MDARRLGAISLALLVLVGVPGIVLALRYAPDPALAHDAVAATDAGPLRLARGAHAWAASLLVALVALHLARSHVAGRMRAPGRAAALAGAGALAAVLAAYFTGTVLPWDQHAWEALQHLREGAGVVGADLPGETPAEAPLRALFLAHILALPLGLVGLLALHVRRRGDGGARRVAALLRATWVPALGVAAIVLALGALLPPALGPAPLEGLAVARPDWPFLWLVPLQDALGPVALLALPLAFAVGALLLARERAPSRRRRTVTLIVLGGAWLLLTVVAIR